MISDSNRRISTVVIVDDEQSVRKLATRMLARMGYTVATVNSGAEALALFADDAEAGDLVLLDLAMPEMDGLQVLQQLRNLYPTLPVVLSSGYLDHECQQSIEGDDYTYLLKKPYRAAGLKKLLQRIDDQLSLSQPASSSSPTAR